MTPSLSWIPEAPLLAVAVPAALLTAAGYRAGVVAAVLAGGIGGLVGGLAYVAYGKPWLNVPLGIAAGGIVGAVLGFAGWSLGGSRGPG